MSIAPDTWDGPAWAAVHRAAPGLDSVVAGLQAIRAACEAAITLTPRTDGFDPASGWQSADGLLALLELTTDLPAAPPLDVEPPKTVGAAAATIEALLRSAADDILAASEALRGGPHTDQLLTLASLMTQLSLSHQRIFGRPW